MLYRRKLLLGFLEALDRSSVSKVDLQKYLFLVCVRQNKPAYEFVPYRFGCFSFQLEADKSVLARYGKIKNEEPWKLLNFGYLDGLNSSDRKTVEWVAHSFRNVRRDALIRYVYRNYPYYAINSEIRHDVLDQIDLARIQKSRPVPRSTGLYTIGYEGKSLERYLNQLIGESINILCDIRKNPISRKFGFSQRQLKGAVEALGMAYVHMPELGIESHRRKSLHTVKDYQSLFEEYVETTLSRRQDSLLSIMKLIEEYDRLALTCFEADYDFCHRGRVVQALHKRADFHHRILHL